MHPSWECKFWNSSCGRLLLVERSIIILVLMNSDSCPQCCQRHVLWVFSLRSRGHDIRRRQNSERACKDYSARGATSVPPHIFLESVNHYRHPSVLLDTFSPVRLEGVAIYRFPNRGFDGSLILFYPSRAWCQINIIIIHKVHVLHRFTSPLFFIDPMNFRQAS